jgi:hypothetical protein
MVRHAKRESRRRAVLAEVQLPARRARRTAVNMPSRRTGRGEEGRLRQPAHSQSGVTNCASWRSVREAAADAGSATVVGLWSEAQAEGIVEGPDATSRFRRQPLVQEPGTGGTPPRAPPRSESGRAAGGRLTSGRHSTLAEGMRRHAAKTAPGFSCREGGARGRKHDPREDPVEVQGCVYASRRTQQAGVTNSLVGGQGSRPLEQQLLGAWSERGRIRTRRHDSIQASSRRG